MPLQPLLLRPDNFTPLTRTPWAGERIVRSIKPFLADGRPHLAVGESWELSVEPDFPSTLSVRSRELREVLAEDPRGYLGREATHWSVDPPGTALLVKLVDTAQPLSVQIHPGDDYAQLGPTESGKPEAWYVVSAEPGSGIYLGLAQEVSRQDVEEALRREADVSSLLCFIPVKPGDFFVIPPGTAHAIGAGLTLVEPQRVIPGRRGVTYRYWDWNRRYDAAGRLDPAGVPRTLHVAHALAVTDWEGPREAALLAMTHAHVGPGRAAADLSIQGLAGSHDAQVRSEALSVLRLCGTGVIPLPEAPVLRALTLVCGRLRLEGDWGHCEIPAGHTAALPAALGATTVHGTRAHALISGIIVP